MKTSSFHPGDYSRGRKHGLELDVGHSGIQLPILLVRGSHEGAALVVTAGIHGDEYEGVRAIFDVVETLDPAAMRGDLIAVPVSNPPAFWAGTRRNPLDGVNLARVFPGAATPTGGFPPVARGNSRRLPGFQYLPASVVARSKLVRGLRGRALTVAEYGYVGA